MPSEGLAARRRRKFRRTTDSKHSHPVAPNGVQRNFRTDAPNQTWVTDVTCIWTSQGWLFLAAMLDLFSRRVVGWATSATNDRELALTALRRAVKQRKPQPGMVHHSNRGSPYASDDYRRELRRHGIVASMSRKGDCWDNTVAESFFSTLKTEFVEDQRSRHHTRNKLLEDLERLSCAPAVVTTSAAPSSRSRADGARADLLEMISHAPRGDIINIYTSMPCEPLRRGRQARHRAAARCREIPLPRAANDVSPEPRGTGLTPVAARSNSPLSPLN